MNTVFLNKKKSSKTNCPVRVRFTTKLENGKKFIRGKFILFIFLRKKYKRKLNYPTSSFNITDQQQQDIEKYIKTCISSPTPSDVRSTLFNRTNISLMIITNEIFSDLLR